MAPKGLDIIVVTNLLEILNPNSTPSQLKFLALATRVPTIT